MQSSIYTKLVLASSIALILSACGGSSSNANTTKEQAINHIETYAQNGATAPTVQDYTNAGVTGVTTANIANINEIVENLTAPEVDTVEEIQNLVNTQGTTTTPPVNQEAPVITINGKNPLYRQLSSIYTELGATATDAIDGPVAVTTTGNVDRHKVGTYTITYTAQDKEGHTSTATRKVIVQGIVHHGVSYGTVISPHTGKVWLDRNIGASKVCDSDYFYDADYACIGDYYQWGRNTDGHEKRNSPSTTKKGKTITDSGNKFVIGHHDWTSATNRTQHWAASDGRSICPVNFRVPTLQELKIEVDKIDNSTMLVSSDSFLKLGPTGRRLGHNGEYLYEEREIFAAFVWTNTSDTNGNTYIYNSYFQGFTIAAAYVSNNIRSEGHTVRCIQH